MFGLERDQRLPAQIMALRGDSFQAGPHARDVPVHNHIRGVVSNAEDGPCRIVTHARERSRLLIIAAKMSAELFGNDFGGTVKITRAAIVTQSRPEFEHPFQGGARQASDGGKSLKEALVIGDHRRNLGLLEHDLRDQDLVRVARLPPGEVPAVLPEPAQEASLKCPQRLSV